MQGQLWESPSSMSRVWKKKEQRFDLWEEEELFWGGLFGLFWNEIIPPQALKTLGSLLMSHCSIWLEWKILHPCKTPRDWIVRRMLEGASRWYMIRNLGIPWRQCFHNMVYIMIPSWPFGRLTFSPPAEIPCQKNLNMKGHHIIILSLWLSKKRTEQRYRQLNLYVIFSYVKKTKNLVLFHMS